MKFASIKKIFSFNWKLPRFEFAFLKRKKRFSRVWRRFLSQIPPTYRHFIQSYPRHFIVIGDESSGKSQLIQKFIDRDRDIYSFETSYTKNSDVQFYLGQRFILQEIAWSLIEDRSIGAKKQLVSLWRQLYGDDREPIFVVAFNAMRWSQADPEKISHYARLLLNKIVLLFHLIDKPIQVRIALTHMDEIEGYTELFRILRSHGIVFDIPLAQYDSETLKTVFKSYEEYLPLILKNATGGEYLKICHFFKSLSDLTFSIDQFCCCLIQKDYEQKVLILDKAYFVSNQESDLGFEIFDCKHEVAPSVYIKRHYFKHQAICLSSVLIVSAFLGGLTLFRKNQLSTIHNKIAVLERYQSFDALHELLPYLKVLKQFANREDYINKIQPSYYALSQQKINDFIEYSRNYILLPTFRRIVLNNQSEIEMIYFLSLAKADRSNKLGQIISENAADWATILNLPEDFITAYLKFARTPQTVGHYLDEFASLYMTTPLSDPRPWFQFFDQLNLALENSEALAIYLPNLKAQAETLLTYLNKVRQSSLTPFLCTLLMEEEELKSQANFLPKIRLFQDLRDNSETIVQLLQMIRQTSLTPPSYSSLNFLAFLGELEKFLSAEDRLNTSLHFILSGRRWKFESNKWNDLVIKTKVSSVADNFISQNREIESGVFFKNASDIFAINFAYLGEVFPQFKDNACIPAPFTIGAYEKHVFPIADAMRRLNESRLITSDIKNVLSQYVARTMESYARQYKTHYENLLKSFNARPVTFEEAEVQICYMTEALSNFTHFLHTVRNNLDIPVSDSLLLHSMPSYLCDFKFFQKLLPEGLDKPGELHHYQAFLTSILQQVREGDLPKKSGDYGILEKYLTPLSRMSLAILTQHSASFQVQLEEWFKKAEVPPKYRAFFLNPVVWVHELGLKELKKSIELAWKQECEPSLCALFQKFPFFSESNQNATYEETHSILHPQSAFWGQLNQILGLVSQINAGEWKGLFQGEVALDPKIYETVNLASHAAKVLWDEQGVPQPISLQVCTIPFTPSRQATERQMIFSYLITAGQTLFNANQQPQYEVLKLKWWDPEEIVVGAEIIDRQTNLTTYKNLKIEAKEWNIFTLFKQSQQKDEHTWSWPIQDEEGQMFDLCLKENPWEILNKGKRA